LVVALVCQLISKSVTDT